MIPPNEFFPQTIEAFIRTDCGWQGPLYFNVGEQSPGCSNPTLPLVVYPNPADNMLIVSMDVKGLPTDEKAVQPQFSVVLYDDRGRPHLNSDSIGGQVELKTDQLPEGAYFLHIHYNGKEERRQIRIRR